MLITLPAPNFIAPAVLNDGTIIENFNLKKFTKQKMFILFFWPMDFTFVCPSELIGFNELYHEFSKRSVEIIGVSVDSVFVHNAWRKTPIKKGGIGTLKYTMVSDIKKEIQKSYQVEHPALKIALRASFLIDKNWIVRHQTINDLPFGRNVNEMLRMVDAIQFHEKSGEVCPLNWTKGQEGIEASSEGIIKYLNKKYPAK